MDVVIVDDLPSARTLMITSPGRRCGIPPVAAVVRRLSSKHPFHGSSIAHGGASGSRRSSFQGALWTSPGAAPIGRGRMGSVVTSC